MASLANQICNDPMLLARLNGFHVQTKQLSASKVTSHEHGEHRAVALAA